MSFSSTRAKTGHTMRSTPQHGRPLYEACSHLGDTQRGRPVSSQLWHAEERGLFIDTENVHSKRLLYLQNVLQRGQIAARRSYSENKLNKCQ